MHTDHPTPPIMAAAVAVDHRYGLKLPAWKRRCRLLSFPHPLNLFEPDAPPSAFPFPFPFPFTFPFPSPAATPAPRAPSAGGGHLKRTPKFSRSFSTPCLYSAAAPTAAADEPRRDSIARLEIVSGRRSRTIHALVVEAAVALASGATPVPVADGISAAHYLFNRLGESFAVMKVMDIDGPPPPAQQGRSVLKHLAAQTSDIGVREVAAYLLDHAAFADVPPTALITIRSPIPYEPTKVVTKRIASIQRFVAHEYDAGELGPSRFSVASVHRIGILDVRILNVDRHAGNILVKKKSGYGNEAMAELVPIDHGLCLPEQLEDPYFEWLHWPQAAVQFSEAEVEYVARLEPFRDVELLQAELPSLQEASRRVLVVCTMFLKRAVEAGLCLAEIGHMMTREFSVFSEGASELEALCIRVEESMRNTSHSPPDHALQQSDDDEASCDADPNVDAAADFVFDTNENNGIFPEQGAKDLPDVPLLPQSQVEGAIKAFDDHEAVADVSDSDNDSDGSVKEHKVAPGGVIAKSFNFSSVDSNRGGIRSVSFEGLSEKEWRLFLERFERLLPDALTTRKSMMLKQPQRLGSSCKL